MPIGTQVIVLVTVIGTVIVLVILSGGGWTIDLRLNALSSGGTSAPSVH